MEFGYRAVFIRGATPADSHASHEFREARYKRVETERFNG